MPLLGIAMLGYFGGAGVAVDRLVALALMLVFGGGIAADIVCTGVRHSPV